MPISGYLVRRKWEVSIVAMALLSMLIMLPSIAFSENKTDATSTYGVGSTFRDCPDCPEIVVVPAGNFLMGTSEADVERDLGEIPSSEKNDLIPFLVKGPKDYMKQEMPQHPVHIDKPFGIGKYPITRDEFSAFVKETNYKIVGDCTLYTPHGRYAYRKVSKADWQNPGFTQSGQDPVICVNTHDAEAYVAWLNTKVKGNKPYHLPSEAEWEYAARAGTQTAYWWGNFASSGKAVCQWCTSVWDNKQTAPVGSFSANPFGLYDMNGNVWEWTADCWNKNYEGAPSDGGAWMTGDCGQRPIRGGSWHSAPWTLRATDRGFPSIDDKSDDIGFRVVREFE